MRKSVEARDWLNTVEPRSVRAVMKRMVEDITQIGTWRNADLFVNSERDESFLRLPVFRDYRMLLIVLIVLLLDFQKVDYFHASRLQSSQSLALAVICNFYMMKNAVSGFSVP